MQPGDLANESQNLEMEMKITLTEYNIQRFKEGLQCLKFPNIDC